MRGAEAVLKKSTLLGKPVLIKQRIQKKYRVKELDENLRKKRTKAEARLLHKAKLVGVLCPTVLEIEDFKLTIEELQGVHPKMGSSEAKKAGEMLVQLHEAGIIHGDYTPVNLIKCKSGLYVIDFGLGFFSEDVEDMAVDVFTMLRSLEKENIKKSFLSGYKKHKNFSTILKRVKEVEKRVRYAV